MTASLDGRIQVIGAGLGRTGTMSLKLMLSRLGWQPYHMDENTHVSLWAGLARAYADGEEKGIRDSTDRIVDAIIQDGFNATTDFPACLIFEYLMERFPDAKVVLTVRSSGTLWAQSVQRTIGRMGKILKKRPLSLFHRQLRNYIDMNNWIWTSKALNLHIDSETGAMATDRLASAYEEWKHHVINTVPSDKLLVRHVSDGWQPLCDFLEVDECPGAEEPTPRSWNTSQNFGLLLDAVEVILTLWLCIIFVMFWLTWRRCGRWSASLNKKKKE